ncbi:MAG: B12-binding domain-containing radical SAM protein, partial [Phycisphaerae bacterium]|nr:B12-binding domain-containing radical SAM protein [Phycisphaerae bacterium]
MTTLRQRVSAELLPYVTQPAQYIGGEINQLVGEGQWEHADVRVVLAFPDTYSLGMSHLGCQVLYWVCNGLPGVVAERAYCPQPDAEARMRARQIPLFTWDTRQPVRDADILGISLQYEMLYSNVLTLLDLAGIPLYAQDRDETHPLVIGGGPQADSPEPVAAFFDLIVNGDGEIAIASIVEKLCELKQGGATREQIIRTLALSFPWLYAPSLYEVQYHGNGTVAAIQPTLAGLPNRIARCQTPDFEEATVPRRPLVPHVQAVHERVSIEIMRGCPQRCRFCHAGYTKRPLRWRSVDC